MHSHVHHHIHTNPGGAAAALDRINNAPPDIHLDPREWQGFPNQQIAPGGCMPPPRIDHSGPPAGQGLGTGEAGWPQGTVTTAGGYHVVATGGTNWDIYAPGQKHGEKPNTHVWGDPHVTEKDGTRWDFTKNSDFMLPDGTRINVETSAETGQSVSTALNIVNGADRVRVDGVNGRPSTSQISHDGYEWRAAHIASNPGRDTFHLAGDQNNVHWIRERNGQMDGVVTGAYYDRTKNGYEQKVDPTLTARVDPSLRPPFGSPAWGNMVRGEANDAFARVAANPMQAAQFGNYMHGQHDAAAFTTWMNSQFQQIQMLIGLMQNDNRWQRQLTQSQYMANPAFGFGFRNMN